MISNWGTVRAIMTCESVLNWCFVVDFHRPVSLNASYSKGVMVNMCGGNGIFDSPFCLRSVYEHDSPRVRILSKNRMAFDIRVIDRDEISKYASVIDDTRVKDLDTQIKQFLGRKNYSEASRLKQKYLLFTKEDCLRFTLQMVRNSGKKILDQGLYLSGDNPYSEFSLQEIEKNYSSRDWQITYRHV